MEAFAIVTNVIDGDTFRGTKILSFPELGREEKHFNQRFRLLGVNTPERGQQGFEEAKQFTDKLIAGKTVKLELFGEDSFGRHLVRVWVDGKCLNDMLLEHGLAKPYVRKRKKG